MRDETNISLGLYDDLAEQTILAALLKSEDDADLIIPMVSAEVFDDLPRSLIYEATAGLRSRGQVVTTSSVVAETKVVAGQRRGLKTVNVVTPGIVDALMVFPTTGKDIRAHADQLTRLCGLRKYSPDLRDLIAMFADRKPIGDMAAKLSGIISAMSMQHGDEGRIIMGYDAIGFIDTMLTRAKMGKIRSYPFPWPAINAFVQPLPPSHMALIAGVDGSGKTAIAETIAEFWTRDLSMHVAYISTEYGSTYIQARRLTRLTGIPTSIILRGQTSLEQDKLIDGAKREIATSYGTLHHIQANGQTPRQIIAELWSLRNIGKLDAIVLDYAQDVTGENPRDDRNARHVRTIVDIHHALADLDIAGIVVAQCKKTGLDDTKDIITREDVDLPQQALSKFQLSWLIWRKRLTFDGEDTRVNSQGIVVPCGYKGGRSSIINCLIDKQTAGPTGTARIYLYQNYQVGDLPEQLQQNEDKREELSQLTK